jgi:hypothetical protein
MGHELALRYEEKVLVYRQRDALGSQEELLQAGQDGGGSGDSFNWWRGVG